MDKRPDCAMNRLIDEYDMLPPGCTVVCAVSGGADSICLLRRLNQLRAIRPFTLVAAHYNHHLRGAESDRDEAFVKRWVEDWCGPDPAAGQPPLPAVRLITGGGDVSGEAKRLGLGLEETARRMRYAFLEEAARAVGADRIATAHTADDNAETVLLHLIRGSGLQGLSAPARGGWSAPCSPPPAGKSRIIWSFTIFPTWRTAPTRTTPTPGIRSGIR